MDLDDAEPPTSPSVTTSQVTSRRGLLGAAGAAGLVGVAAALLSDGPASASPSAPTPTDTALLGQAQELELTVRDLYQLALDAGVSDDGQVIATIGDNHRAYAEAIAGASGLSARGRNDEVFDEFAPRFDTSDLDALTEVGREVEEIAVATHTALMGQYESASARNLTASILVVEARHAVVLGDIGGGAPDDLLEADGEALVITAEVTS